MDVLLVGYADEEQQNYLKGTEKNVIVSRVLAFFRYTILYLCPVFSWLPDTKRSLKLYVIFI